MGIPQLLAFSLRGTPQLALVSLLTLALAWVFPPFGWISGAFIALALLRRGSQAAVIGLLLATLLFVAVLALFWGQSLGASLVLPLFYWLPPLLPAWVLRRFVDLSLAVLSSALLWAVAIMLLHALSDPAALWRDLVDVQVTAAEELNPELGAVDLRTLLYSYSGYITGGLASVFFLFSLVSLMLARAWQSRLFNPGGFRQEYLRLSFGRIAAAAAALVSALSLLFSAPLWDNIAILAALLFTIQGVAVLHALVSDRGLGGGAILFIYALLLASIFMPLILGAYSILGLVDNWFGFRTRFAGQSGS